MLGSAVGDCAEEEFSMSMHLGTNSAACGDSANFFSS